MNVDKVEMKKCMVRVKSNDAKSLKTALQALYDGDKVRFSCYVFFFTDENTPTINPTHKNIVQISFKTKNELTEDFRREIYESIYEKANAQNITINKIEIDYDTDKFPDGGKRYADVKEFDYEQY